MSARRKRERRWLRVAVVASSVVCVKGATNTTNHTALNYTDVQGVSCQNHMDDNERCFAGQTYSSVDAASGECWDLCSHNGYASEFDLGYASATYGAAGEGTCCCATACPCVENSTDTSVAVELGRLGLFECDDDAPFNSALFPVEYPFAEVGGAECVEPADEFCISADGIGSNTECLSECLELTVSVTDPLVAYLDGNQCCCASSCGCLSDSPGHAITTSHPIPDCHGAPEDEHYHTYRNYACSQSQSSIDVYRDSVDPVACWEACLDVVPDLVGAVADPETSTCSCFDACPCLEEADDGVETALSVIAEPAEACHDSILSPDRFERLYDTYASVSCGEGSENRLCFDSFDYDAGGSDWLARYQCWAWCTLTFEEVYDAPLEATYGDANTGMCCCVTSCGCLADDHSDVLLSYYTNASTPVVCDGDDDDDNGSSISSDLWWAILVVIVAAVAVIFFCMVEEVDKARRKKAQKEPKKVPPSPIPASRQRSQSIPPETKEAE